jgi:hypothetical protein
MLVVYDHRGVEKLRLLQISYIPVATHGHIS